MPYKRVLALFAASAALFVDALFLARSQETVDDVSWMKAMIRTIPSRS